MTSEQRQRSSNASTRTTFARPAWPSNSWPSCGSPPSSTPRPVAERRELLSRPQLFPHGAAAEQVSRSTSPSCATRKRCCDWARHIWRWARSPQCIPRSKSASSFIRSTARRTRPASIARRPTGTGQHEAGRAIAARQHRRQHAQAEQPRVEGFAVRAGHAAARNGPLRGSDRHAGRSRRALSGGSASGCVAQYVIGESYRRWAEELLERLRECTHRERAREEPATRHRAAQHGLEALRRGASATSRSRHTTSTATR